MSSRTLTAPSLHPHLQSMAEAHLGAGPDLTLEALGECLRQADESQRLELVLAVSQAFRNIDRELEHTMRALDLSMEEAVALNQELKNRATGLESALAAKELALAELGSAKIQLLNQEKLASIGTLAAGIAHEINTPTQFVSDNLNFLQDAFAAIVKVLEGAAAAGAVAVDDPRGAWALLDEAIAACDLDFYRAEVPEALKQSIDGMGRVAQIVRSMKEFSHPGKGGKRAVDLNRNVLSTLTVCRNEWKYVAEMETCLDETLPPVPCAPEEINQVVLNLVVNAAHAIQDAKHGAKGLIKVSTLRDGDGVRISVSDNGCGISDEIKARVYDPFFTTKEVGRGTGQGLALAYHVVAEKHQGRLSFDTCLGQGTTFHLWLPLAGSLT